MMDYRERAIECVKDTVLPLHARRLRECGGDLDLMYKKYSDTAAFFAEVLEPGHIYEVGFPSCVCPRLQYGETHEPEHCECSRQSLLYILENLMPGKRIAVETLETVFTGGECCRFRLTVE